MNTNQTPYGLSIENQNAPGALTMAVDRRRLVLGSSTSCDVRLDDPRVSPIHAIIEVDNTTGIATLYDLASEHGTLVANQKIVQSALKPGDSFQIGSHVIFFRRSQDLQNKSETPDAEDRSPFLLEEGDQITEIFDFRPEAIKSLQVVMLYLDTILEVSHFPKKKKVVIGPKASDDFGVPPLLKGETKAQYELVTATKGASGTGYVLNLHDSMTGVVSLGGKMKPVKQVIAELGGARAVAISEQDFAKVSMGDVSFFVSFSPSPPRLKRQRLMGRDAVFARIWFTSLAATLVVIYAISKAVVNPVIEIEQLPERIATIIYKPELLPVAPQPKPPTPKVEQPKEEPKPPAPKKEVIKVTPKEVTKPKPKDAVIGKEEPKKAPVPKAATPKPAQPKAPGPKANAAGNEGAGARAAGDNGTRGKPDAKPGDTHQTKAMRPGAGPKNAPANARPGASQVQDLGVVDVFKSSGGKLDKILAGGKGISGAADKLEGFGGFTTRGAGGLGDAGTGAGGGGTSMGLGGLADKGVGGGRKGTGLGALGTGGNIIGGSGKLVVAGGNGAPEPIVLGAIDTDAIARAIAEHRDEIKYCYEKEINAENPDLAGRISVRWVIGASGQVTTAGVASSTMRNGNVESCVVSVIKRIAFPPVKGGGIAEVTYPFVFRPSDR